MMFNYYSSKYMVIKYAYNRLQMHAWKKMQKKREEKQI